MNEPLKRGFMISPTFLQDQILLRDFYRMPDGVWLGFRSGFLEVYNQARVAAGWFAVNGADWQVRRNGSWFEFNDVENNRIQLVLDFSKVNPGQSLYFAFAFSSRPLALGRAATVTAALDFNFHEPSDSYPHDCYYSWDQFQASNAKLKGQTAAFQLGEKENLRLAGKINPNNTVDLVLSDLSPDVANHIISLLKGKI